VSVANEGVVEVSEHLADGVVLDADDDAIWLVEVVDRITFFEELGVVCDIEGDVIADDFAYSISDAESGADWDGGFHDDNLRLLARAELLDRMADVVGGPVDIGHVGVALVV